MQEYTPKDINLADINFRIYSGHVEADYETWVNEAQKFMEYTHLHRLQYGFQYYVFNHLGRTFYLIDTPKSWRLYVNTQGTQYRWEFTENIPGYLSTFVLNDEGKEVEESIHHIINTRTAKDWKEAIKLFISTVVRVKCGSDEMKDHYQSINAN